MQLSGVKLNLVYHNVRTARILIIYTFHRPVAFDCYGTHSHGAQTDSRNFSFCHRRYSGIQS